MNCLQHMRYVKGSEFLDVYSTSINSFVFSLFGGLNMTFLYLSLLFASEAQRVRCRLEKWSAIAAVTNFFKTKGRGLIVHDPTPGRVTNQTSLSQRHLVLVEVFSQPSLYSGTRPPLTMSFITVAAATLPSVPLDFQGNRDRIIESIRIAKAKGATLRTGPEVCIARKLNHFSS